MDNLSKLYATEILLTALGIDVPRWIDQDIYASQVAAILEGGCASGAYMPAVTYYDAVQTMARHGDDVLQFIEDDLGELPPIPVGSSWSGIACHYLSCAVELWAEQVQDEVCEALDETEEEAE